MLLYMCIATLLLVFYMLYHMVSFYRKSRRFPPGPFPLPIIGNLHLLSNKPYLDLSRLAKRYGPVYRLQMGFNRVVVINNNAMAREAMVKMGADFSGRPSHFVGSLFSRNGKGVGFQTYTETWKKQQKAVIQKIKEASRQKPNLEDMVTLEVNDLLSRMNSHGGSFVDPRIDVTFAFGNVVASLAFGSRYEDGDSEFLQLMNALTIFVEGLAATSFIDTFPFLQYVPFPIIQRVRGAVKTRDEILDRKYNEHKTEHRSADHRDLTDLLIAMAQKKSRGTPDDDMSEDHIVMTMNDTVMAGSETPTMNFLWVIYFLVKYPDVQQRLQRELDDVIGRDRPPKWSECQKLPYLEAFTHEVFRHGSVMPLGIPHQAMCDSTLGPYQIPRGTTVLLNIWTIHHDPEVWEDPMEFNPERFLDEDGSLSSERAASLLSFGLGHRMCPGEALARMEVFLFTSHLLQRFNFRCDESIALPNVEDCSFGITLRPAPFKVCANPRD